MNHKDEIIEYLYDMTNLLRTDEELMNTLIELGVSPNDAKISSKIIAVDSKLGDVRVDILVKDMLCPKGLPMLPKEALDAIGEVIGRYIDYRFTLNYGAEYSIGALSRAILREVSEYRNLIEDRHSIRYWREYIENYRENVLEPVVSYLVRNYVGPSDKRATIEFYKADFKLYGSLVLRYLVKVN